VPFREEHVAERFKNCILPPSIAYSSRLPLNLRKTVGVVTNQTCDPCYALSVSPLAH